MAVASLKNDAQLRLFFFSQTRYYLVFGSNLHAACDQILSLSCVFYIILTQCLGIQSFFYPISYSR